METLYQILGIYGGYEILRIFGGYAWDYARDNVRDFVLGYVDYARDYVWDYVRDYVESHIKLEEDLAGFRMEFRVLKRKEIDINLRIQEEAEVHPWQVVKEEVRGWLEEVQKIEEDIQDVEEMARRVSYFQRANLDKLVCKKIKVLKSIRERSNFNEGPVTESSLAPRISTKGKIWEYLMGDEVGMIGVCGIGGIGKTTIMKHVYSVLLTRSRFQKVIWVTVSYPLNVLELQKEIALAMGITLSEHEEMMWATILKEMMGRKRFVLILDDVWEKIFLSDVGIPKPTPQNGCKVVVISRSVDLCNFLGCEIVKVQPLLRVESLNLFLSRVGHDVLQVAGVDEILKLFVEECAGLPLAIVIIAGGMRGERNIREWINALSKLRSQLRIRAVSVMVPEDEDEYMMFERLKYSYNRLSLEIQKCFFLLLFVSRRL